MQPRLVSERMSTAGELPKQMLREDVVSWIGEFSYIFLFDPDDSQLPSDQNYCLQPLPPEIDVDKLLNTVLQIPDPPSNSTAGHHVRTLSRRPSCANLHILSAGTSTPDQKTQYVEADEEFTIYPGQRSACPGCGSTDATGATKRRKRRKKIMKLFRGYLEKDPDLGCKHCRGPRTENSQVDRGNSNHDYHSQFRQVAAGSHQTLQLPVQPIEHSQPRSSRSSKSLEPTDTPSKKEIQRKTWLAQYHRDQNSNQNGKPSRVPGASSSRSSLLEVKQCLKSLSPRRLKTKATARWPRNVALPPPREDRPEIMQPTVVDGSASSQITPLPRHHASRGTSADSKTLTVGANTLSSNISGAGSCKHQLQLNIETSPLAAPRPFQCTFCLTQCTGKQDWNQHERSNHFQRRGWGNVLDGLTEEQSSCYALSSSQRSSDTCVTPICEGRRPSHRSEPEGYMNDWYWNCGFCSLVLRSWDERQEHIADEHFEKGTTMSVWDPLKPPLPWKRSTGTPVPGFPSWDLDELLAIQQPNLADSIDLVGETPMHKSFKCKLCHLPTKNLEISTKHTELWHKPREIWSCPRAIAPDELFFDTYDNRRDGRVKDVCFCCGKPFYSYERDPDMLMEHLRDIHNFDEYPCLQTCFDKQQFYLHLANNHGFFVEYIQEFMEFCKLRSRAPATMVGLKS